MVGLRRALALLILGFYVTQFAMTAWLGPDEVFACYLALALCYGLAFIGLGAEWFWARWFAIGVGNFGSLALLVLLKIGMEPIIAFFGFTHLAIWLMLLGEGMASRYEHSAETAERWNFQEESLVLMRRAVKSAGTTLPFVILYTLGPQPEAMHLMVLGLALAGLYGLLRARTWGVLALAGAGTIALCDGLGLFGAPTVGYLLLTPRGAPVIFGSGVGLLAAGALLPAIALAGPMIRWLAKRSR